MSKFIALDYETYPISNEHPWPKPVCLSYYDGINPAEILIGEQIPEFLAKHIGNTPLIAHNMKFEMLVTYYWYPELREQIWKSYQKGILVCTHVNEVLIDNVREHSIHKFDLASIVFNYFKEDISQGKKNPDAWRLRYNELDGIPVKDWPIEAIEYSKSDSIWAYKVYLKQSVANVQSKDHVLSDFCLNLMGTRGILVDLERVAILEKEIIEKLKPARDYLIEQGIYRVEKGNIKKSMGVLRGYVEANIQSPIKTAKGVIGTSAENLVQYLLQKPDDKVLQSHKHVMEFEKVQTAYIKSLKRANPTIRTSYKPVVTSGRTSASGTPLYPSMNIQQPPRAIKGVTWDVRSCFGPRPGFKFVPIDFAGLELASCAHQLAKIVTNVEPFMLNAINRGDTPTDMHSLFAVEIRNRDGRYGTCTYEQFKANKKKETYKEFRQLAKPINLGFPGGIGYDTMSTLLFNEGIQLRLAVLAEIEVKVPQWKDWHTGEMSTHPHISQLEARNKRRAHFLQVAAAKNKLKAQVLQLEAARNKLRAQGKEDVRVKRVSWGKFQLVKDELVLLKKTLMDLYPELKMFLTETHKEFVTDNTKRMQNEYGEWELEPMYRYDFYGVRRDWATYTAACNGILMQTPSACGAKRAVNNIIRYTENVSGEKEIFPLAFIHDEICFEIKDNANLLKNAILMSEMMIDGMQEVLTLPRIAVEYDIMDWWSKSGTGGPSGTLWKDPRSNILRGK